MRCSYCEPKAFPMHSSSSLVNGSNNFKRETLTKHLKSKSHVYCRDGYLSRSSRSKATTQQEALPEVLTRQETAQQADLQQELEIKFNVAYARAMEELLFTMYWLLLLLLLLLKKNWVAIKSTYNNNVKCAEFLWFSFWCSQYFKLCF